MNMNTGALNNNIYILFESGIVVFSRMPRFISEHKVGLDSKVVGSDHCCQIAENSTILLKSSGKKYVFAEEIDSGTTIKFIQK